MNWYSNIPSSVTADNHTEGGGRGETESPSKNLQSVSERNVKKYLK